MLLKITTMSGSVWRVDPQAKKLTRLPQGDFLKVGIDGKMYASLPFDGDGSWFPYEMISYAVGEPVRALVSGQPWYSTPVVSVEELPITIEWDEPLADWSEEK